MTSTARAAWLLAVASTLAPSVALADEPVLLGLEGAYAMPITSPQLGRFDPGGSLALALHLPLASWIAPVVRARGVLLADGAPPADSSLRDPGVGTAFSLTGGLRLRPRGWLEGQERARATDLWIEASAGATLTGALVRPFFEVGVGYGLEAGDLRIGPSVRLMHVLHYDDPLDASSALVLSAGLEIVIFDRGELELEPEPEEPEPTAEVATAPEVAPAEPAAAAEEPLPAPDPDSDRDAIVDRLDACPREPETVNGIDDRDGCPDEGLIEMVEDRIVIEEVVLFDFGRARVKHAARPVLAAIVELWRQHPEWARMRIEGHADVRGPDDVNLRLSELRARRVRDALTELGMPAERIEIVGHGRSRPRDMRTTEAAHQRNRRVEFVVVGRDAPSSAR